MTGEIFVLIFEGLLYCEKFLWEENLKVLQFFQEIAKIFHKIWNFIQKITQFKRKLTQFMKMQKFCGFLQLQNFLPWNFFLQKFLTIKYLLYYCVILLSSVKVNVWYNDSDHLSFFIIFKKLFKGCLNISLLFIFYLCNIVTLCNTLRN